LGWMTPDLTGLSREAIVPLVAKTVGRGHPAKATVPAGMLWRFINEITIDDFVLTPIGATREILIGRVKGPYEFHQQALVGDCHHYRRVEWEGRRSRDLLSQNTLYSLGSISTLFTFQGAEAAVQTLLAS